MNPTIYNSLLRSSFRSSSLPDDLSSGSTFPVLTSWNYVNLDDPIYIYIYIYIYTYIYTYRQFSVFTTSVGLAALAPISRRGLQHTPKRGCGIYVSHTVLNCNGQLLALCCARSSSHTSSAVWTPFPEASFREKEQGQRQWYGRYGHGHTGF